MARKYDNDGKLLPEMILVCNALRNDLSHPNEYVHVHGYTVRACMHKLIAQALSAIRARSAVPVLFDRDGCNVRVLARAMLFAQLLGSTLSQPLQQSSSSLYPCNYIPNLCHMVLVVVNAYRFVRGATLRFLCRLREPELLEPLIPTIKVRVCARHYNDSITC